MEWHSIIKRNIDDSIQLKSRILENEAIIQAVQHIADQIVKSLTVLPTHNIWRLSCLADITMTDHLYLRKHSM